MWRIFLNADIVVLSISPRVIDRHLHSLCLFVFSCVCPASRFSPRFVWLSLYDCFLVVFAAEPFGQHPTHSLRAPCSQHPRFRLPSAITNAPLAAQRMDGSRQARAPAISIASRLDTVRMASMSLQGTIPQAGLIIARRSTTYSLSHST